MGMNGATQGMTQDELALFETMLLERRRSLLTDFQAMEDADARDGSEASALPSHIADQGSDRAESDVSLGRREASSTEIQEIDEALERIRDGSFGLCENCDKPIAKGPIRIRRRSRR